MADEFTMPRLPPPPPTARLEFRRWTAADRALVERLWCDPEVMRFIGGPYTHDEVTARIERELANDASHGVQYWPLFTRERGEFAGCCGLKPQAATGVVWASGLPVAPQAGQRPTLHDALEIGFQLLPRFWRAGYASEAARAVIAYAFDQLQTKTLYAGRHPENVASDALLVKLGFTQIGTHHFARTGLDHPWYELRNG